MCGETENDKRNIEAAGQNERVVMPAYTRGEHNGWPCVLNKGEPLPGDDFVEELNFLHRENEELKSKIGLAHELFSEFMSTPYDISDHDIAKEVAAWMQSESILILDKLEV